MKWFIFGFVLFLTAWAWSATSVTGMTVKNAQVVIKNAQAYLVSATTATVAVVGTTGQCIGILCGVTHAD